MTDERKALLSCPFCGSDAATVTKDHGTYEPGCTHCGTFIGQYSSERSAIAAWNRRALPTPPRGMSDEEIEAVMELARQYAHAYFNHHTGSRDGMLEKTRNALRAVLAASAPKEQAEGGKEDGNV